MPHCAYALCRGLLDAPDAGWLTGAPHPRVCRFRPLLTPSGCAGGSQVLDPPLSPQAAADIYAGGWVCSGRAAARLGRPAVIPSLLQRSSKRTLPCRTLVLCCSSSAAVAGKLEAVDEGTLREAQRISRFAVAAYGLQSMIWAQGERPGACLANANRLVKCFKAPLGLETSLRKHNFDAIVRITGGGWSGQLGGWSVAAGVS